MTDYTDEPRESLRPVVTTSAALDRCLASLDQGSGPVAFDTERAHGFRYWPKAYLLQIRRAGTGTWLIDPVAFEDGGPADMSSLVEACGDATWVLHAASQDLPCMREVGIVPGSLFDTELGGRLLGEPLVSLGALLEAHLGVRLRKAHSAQNWATRPLPTNWLAYAALDVDYLLELASWMELSLEAAGRLDWARQEFEAELAQHSVEPIPREEPWRRLAGISDLRTTRQLALARALWLERDRIAEERDRPPGHILPDQAIIGLALRVQQEGPLPPASVMDSIPGFGHRGARRHRAAWIRALRETSDLHPSQYPARRPPATGTPHPRNWDKSRPEAARMWPLARAAVDELACDLGIQPNLIAPSATLQAVVYEQAATGMFADWLTEHGSRAWQVSFLAPLLDEARQAV